MKMRLLAALLCAAPMVAVADGSSNKSLDDLLRVKMRTVQHLALNPAIIRAVRAQNGEKLSLDTIKQRDGEWKGTKDLTHFKRSLVQSGVGRFLRGQVERKGSSFNEAFLTDNQGANVAAFPPTSDYWQGDEEKWTGSYNSGEGQLFLGPIEKDESTGVEAVQISAPVFDRGKTIGVLVVGVTLDYIDSKRAQ